MHIQFLNNNPEGLEQEAKRIDKLIGLIGQKEVLEQPFTAFQNSNMGILKPIENAIATLDINYFPKSLNPAHNSDLIKAQLQYTLNSELQLMKQNCVVDNKIMIAIE